MTQTRTTQRGRNTRQELLRLLRETGPDKWLSGEEASLHFGISRMAIAKHIHVLRNDGNTIEASPRKGYRLLAEAANYSECTVREGLKTRLLGQSQWLWLEETASTNTMAARLAIEGAQEGSVVVARRQLAGRGQKGRMWLSLSQAIEFSVILRPAYKLSQERLLKIVLQAAAESITEATGLCPMVKPPNDLFINGRKVCGVLIETGMRGSELDWVVVGVGLNVNSKAKDFSGRLEQTATSLSVEKGHDIERSGLLRRILERLDALYEEEKQA